MIFLFIYMKKKEKIKSDGVRGREFGDRREEEGGGETLKKILTNHTRTILAGPVKFVWAYRFARVT